MDASVQFEQVYYPHTQHTHTQHKLGCNSVQVEKVLCFLFATLARKMCEDKEARTETTLGLFSRSQKGTKCPTDDSCLSHVLMCHVSCVMSCVTWKSRVVPVCRGLPYWVPRHTSHVVFIGFSTDHGATNPGQNQSTKFSRKSN